MLYRLLLLKLLLLVVVVAGREIPPRMNDLLWDSLPTLCAEETAVLGQAKELKLHRLKTAPKRFPDI
jgi:hypothetical protein